MLCSFFLGGGGGGGGAPSWNLSNRYTWLIKVESDSSWQSKRVRAFAGVLGKVNLIEGSWYAQESPFCIVLL